MQLTMLSRTYWCNRTLLRYKIEERMHELHKYEKQKGRGEKDN